MTRNEILLEVYDTKIIERVCSSMWSRIGDLKDDFVQYAWLLVCEMPAEKIESLYNKGQLDFYIYSVIRNQAFNDKSSFHKLYSEQLDKVYGEIERMVKNEERM